MHRVRLSSQRHGSSDKDRRSDDVAKDRGPAYRKATATRARTCRATRDATRRVARLMGLPHILRSGDFRCAFSRSAALLGICLALPAPDSTGFGSGCAPPPPPSVTVAKPVVKDIIERDDFIGRFEAVDQVEIRRAGLGGNRRQGSFPGRHARQGRATCSSPSIRVRTRTRSREAKSAVYVGPGGGWNFAQSDLDRAQQPPPEPATSPTSCSTSAGNPLLTAKAELDRSLGDLAPGASSIWTSLQIKAPLGGAYLAQARLGGQPRGARTRRS